MSEFSHTQTRDHQHLLPDHQQHLLTVWSTLLSKTSHHINEAAVILDTFASTSSWLLGLLLRFHLWSLSAHLSGTSKGSVYFSCTHNINTKLNIERNQDSVCHMDGSAAIAEKFLSRPPTSTCVFLSLPHHPRSPQQFL